MSVKLKKRGGGGLCYITDEEAAQTCLCCTLTCNQDNIERLEMWRHRCSASSLCELREEERTTLLQVRPHSLCQRRVYLLTSNVNILYKVIPIHFGKNMFIFVQLNSEREWTEMLRVVKTDLYKFSALCFKLTWLTLQAQPLLRFPVVSRGVWELRYRNWFTFIVNYQWQQVGGKKGHCILKQRFCVFKKGQYCNLELNNLFVNIVRNCVHYTQ